MANVKKTNIDSIKQPVRKNSYAAPEVRQSVRVKESVPKEYRTFKKAPKKRGGMIFLLFLLAVAAFAGWAYWSDQQGKTSDRSLTLSVQGPGQITSGDEVTYLVEYQNTDSVPLTEMKLSVFWPEGFYFDQATLEPVGANAKTWNLPDLSPGQTASLEIKGQLVGKQDEELNTIFTLDYQPSNFHSDFQEKQTVTTKVISNKLELLIDAPDKILVQTETELKIIVRNLTDESLADLYLDVIYPEDWIIGSVEPEKTEDFWPITLAANEEKIVTIKGTFSADSQIRQSIVAEIGNKVDDNFRRLSRAKHDLQVVNPKFNVSLKVNGLAGDQAVNWGDTLRYQLSITNDSSSDVNDVQVTATVLGELVDWDSLDTAGQNQQDKIIWTKEQDQELSLWPAGATKTLTWEVKVVSEPQAERMIENIIQLNIVGLTGWEQVVTASRLTVGESLAFNAGVYWHLGGRRVGEGLLPPQVGEETKYLVVWSLPTATGDFDEVTVSTILPPNVAFANQTENGEGEIEFDATTRTVTWQLDNFQDILLPTTASFMISITPGEEDRDQAMVLLNAASAEAQGLETVIVRSKIIKTTDVVAETSEPIGIVQ